MTKKGLGSYSLLRGLWPLRLLTLAEVPLFVPEMVGQTEESNINIDIFILRKKISVFILWYNHYN